MSLVETAAADALAHSLREHDRDRYLSTLFAPADRRTALIALYSFNFEVAKTREVVREPLLGQIRLQWWRDAIGEIYAGGAVRRHEVVEPLAEAVRRFDLTRYHFDRLIDAREADLGETPPASLAVLERYAENTSSRLMLLALEILGARDPASGEAGRHAGMAWALTGLIRAVPVHARMRRSMLPADLAAEYALDDRAFFELRPSPALAAIVARIAETAGRHVAAARALHRKVPRHARPALLPVVLAKAHLHHIARAGHDPFAASLALPDTLASWRMAMASLAGWY